MCEQSTLGRPDLVSQLQIRSSDLVWRGSKSVKSRALLSAASIVKMLLLAFESSMEAFQARRKKLAKDSTQRRFSMPQFPPFAGSCGDSRGDCGFVSCQDLNRLQQRNAELEKQLQLERRGGWIRCWQLELVVKLQRASTDC